MHFGDLEAFRSLKKDLEEAMPSYTCKELIKETMNTSKNKDQGAELLPTCMPK